MSKETVNPGIPQILMAKGFLSNDQFAIVKKEREKTGKNFSQTLVALGFISEQSLNQIVAEHGGFTALDLSSTSLDHELIKTLPRHIAEQRQMIPVSMEGSNLLLALVDVYDLRALDQARKYFPHCTLQPVLTNSAQLKAAIDRYYGYELTVDKLLKEIESSNVALEGETTWVSPVVRLVETLLIHGIKLGASDVHFQPEESFVRVDIASMASCNSTASSTSPIGPLSVCASRLYLI